AAYVQALQVAGRQAVADQMQFVIFHDGFSLSLTGYRYQHTPKPAFLQRKMVTIWLQKAPADRLFQNLPTIFIPAPGPGYPNVGGARHFRPGSAGICPKSVEFRVYKMFFDRYN